MTVHVNEFSSDPTLITRGPNPSSLEPLEIGEELSMCRGAILWGGDPQWLLEPIGSTGDACTG